MAEEANIARANEVYNQLRKVLDDRNWNYKAHDDDRVITFNVQGEDIPMDFLLVIDAERDLIRLLSRMPFKMSEEKRLDGAIIACAATYGLVNGGFDYDLSDGSITFRLTTSYKDCVVGDNLFNYMIDVSCGTIDDYNDKFMAVDKGYMTVQQFIEKTSE